MSETINAEPIQPTGLINQSASFSYNAKRNRLNAMTGHSFGYDNEGQLSSKDGTVYDFDHAHRLVQVGTTTYTYDGVGNRIRATRGGVTTQYLYDAAGNLLAEANGAGVITRYYIYGLRRAGSYWGPVQIRCSNIPLASSSLDMMG